MREIKFRAWDTEANTWLEGVTYTLHTSGRLLTTPPNVILMQYTGLKDAKGKEIYEGDIVTYLRDTGDKNEEIDYVVELDLASLDFLIFIDDGQYTCKVIGNIYENPELV